MVYFGFYLYSLADVDAGGADGDMYIQSQQRAVKDRAAAQHRQQKHMLRALYLHAMPAWRIFLLKHPVHTHITLSILQFRCAWCAHESVHLLVCMYSETT